MQTDIQLQLHKKFERKTTTAPHSNWEEENWGIRARNGCPLYEMSSKCETFTRCQHSRNSRNEIYLSCLEDTINVAVIKDSNRLRCGSGGCFATPSRIENVLTHLIHCVLCIYYNMCIFVLCFNR